MKKQIAAGLALALMAGPAPAFVVEADGSMSMDARESQMVATVCAGPATVCTFFHFAKLQFDIVRLTQKAHDEGKAAGLAEGCKGKT